MKAHDITVLKTVCKSDNKWLRYPNIGSKITNMLENASQGIACDFGASQQLLNVPSLVSSIAACGWALTLSWPSEYHRRGCDLPGREPHRLGLSWPGDTPISLNAEQ